MVITVSTHCVISFGAIQYRHQGQFEEVARQAYLILYTSPYINFHCTRHACDHPSPNRRP